VLDKTKEGPEEECNTEWGERERELGMRRRG